MVAQTPYSKLRPRPRYISVTQIPQIDSRPVPVFLRDTELRTKWERLEDQRRDLEKRIAVLRRGEDEHRAEFNRQWSATHEPTWIEESWALTGEQLHTEIQTRRDRVSRIDSQQHMLERLEKSHKGLTEEPGWITQIFQKQKYKAWKELEDLNRQIWEREADMERKEQKRQAEVARRKAQERAEFKRREEEEQAEFERRVKEERALFEKRMLERAGIARREQEEKAELERQEQEKRTQIEERRLEDLETAENLRFERLMIEFESEIRAELSKHAELARPYLYDDLSPSSSRFRLLRLHSARESQILARTADTVPEPEYSALSTTRDRYDRELFDAQKRLRQHQATFYQRYEGALQCSMQTFDLDDSDCPHFEALSYEWNANSDKGRKRLVLFDDDASLLGSMEIGYNLWSFLKHIKQTDESIWLWEDAVCINQASFQERGHQLKLMGQIYTRASRVLAWLPVDDPGSSITKRKQLLAKRTERQGKLDVAVDFLGSHYWTRKWIIQAILLARTVVLVVGGHELPMQDLENVLAEQEQTNPSASTSAFASLPVTKLAAYRRSRREGKTYPGTLCELLPMYQDNMCSDPFDYVYALYNLIGEHRKNLEVKNGQPACEWIPTVLQFLDRHEPQSRSTMAHMALILARQNQSYDLHSSTMSLEEALVNVVATAYDQGALVAREDCTRSMIFRDQVSSLHPGAKSESRDRAQSRASHTVSKRVLEYFELPGQSLCGLAAARIEQGDRVWRFINTKLGFIVRPEERPAQHSDRFLRILGRCYLFETSGAEQSIETFTSDQTSNNGENLQSYDLRLGVSDLFTLAYAAVDSEFLTDRWEARRKS